MSNRTAAARYAKALFDVALKESSPERAERDLADFANLFEKNDDLRRALTNPAVPVTGKRGIVEQLVVRGKPVSPVAKLLHLLAERNRFELLPDLLQGYRERLMEHQHVIQAEIVTAVPLSDDRAATLQRRLAQVTGRTVRMDRRVDPSIVGGIVARVGSTVYDGSIATHLARMREKLIAET